MLDPKGLLDENNRPTAKWSSVVSLNQKLKALGPTYLALESNDVFNADVPSNRNPRDIVGVFSSRSDLFVGTFTHNTDGSRYIQIVNENCVPSRTRSTVMTLYPTGLDGPDRTYRLLDVYTGERVYPNPGSNMTHPRFSMSLGPGAGVLYKIEPDRPGTVGITPSHAPRVEATLTADLRDDDRGVKRPSWQWESSDGETWTAISGATGATFVPKKAHQGLRLRAVVTYEDMTSVDAEDRRTATSRRTKAVIDVPGAPASLTATGGDTRVTLS